MIDTATGTTSGATMTRRIAIRKNISGDSLFSAARVGCGGWALISMQKLSARLIGNDVANQPTSDESLSLGNKLLSTSRAEGAGATAACTPIPAVSSTASSYKSVDSACQPCSGSGSSDDS